MSAGLQSDLIAAVATAPGQGGVGVVRLSGQGAADVGETICGCNLQPRHATYCEFSDGGEVLDQGIALLFADHASFTGEEVVELQGHGGPVVLQRVLNAACSLGARLARPGEFSERAFLNGNIDLAQAEAIADLIASTSVSAARAALRSLQGAFSERVQASAEALAKLRVLVEACIDFPDEDVDFLQDANVDEEIGALLFELTQLRLACVQGQLVNEGASVALLGAPNAGKSSLLNALSGQDAAIVTAIAGTTRDLLKVDMVIDGVPLRLVDTAGLRDSGDEVERLGVARARDQARLADLLVLVVDAAMQPASGYAGSVTRLLAGLRYDGQVVVVMNKVDLLPAPGCAAAGEGEFPTFWVSVKTGEGMAGLRRGLTRTLGLDNTEVGFTARARHVAAVERSIASLSRAQTVLRAGEATEVVAEELRAAHMALGELVGTVTPDDLLGRIFSEFCIGK